MARSSQTARRAYRHDVSRRPFTDHTGCRAVRFGIQDRRLPDNSPWPPPDYAVDPKFVFQVYLSVDLKLNEDELDSETTATFGEEWSQREASRYELLTRHLVDLADVQRPAPMWEFYYMPDATVLDFVEHSRREIAHRKRLRATGDVTTPLIPKLAFGEHDGRRHGFLFAIDNDRGWHKPNDRYRPTFEDTLKWPDKSGPLWVYFDARLPCNADSLNVEWTMETDPIDYRGQMDDMVYFPDQLDMQVKRIQNSEQSSMASHSVYRQSMTPAWLWIESRYDDSETGIDFGDHDSHNEEIVVGYKTALGSLQDAVFKLHLLDVEVTLQRINDTTLMLSNTAEVEPDVHYIVYVGFAAQRIELFEDTACAFAAAFIKHLPDDKTVTLEFRIPPSNSDAAVLASYIALKSPENAVGVLTDLWVPRSHGDPVHYERPREPGLRRLYPLSINPHAWNNDPATSFFSPHSNFIIIIDRPDFLSVPGIRYLLTGGGPSTHAPSIAQDYVEMEAWRAPADMAVIVDRLTLAQPNT